MDGRVRHRARQAVPIQPRGAARTRAEHVDHRGRRERLRRPEIEATDRPDVLLELGGGRALDRPVAAVVDARRELVDDEPAVRHQEQLGGQRAGHADRHRQPLGQRDRPVGDVRVDAGRGDALDEDARVVAVAGERVRGHAAERAARDHDRQLALEVHLGLGEQRRTGGATERRQGAVDLGRVRDAELAAAVVAAGRDLEPQGQAQAVERDPEVVGRPDLAPRRDDRAGRFEEPPLGQAVLRDVERHAPRADRPQHVDRVDHLGGDVLELVGDDVAALGEPERPADVVVAGHDHGVGDGRRRAGRVGVEHRDPVAHRPRRQTEHPPELSTAEDPDRGRRDQRTAFHAELAVDIGDPGLLAVGVLVGLDRTTLDDAGLERGIAGDERRVGEQGVAEGQVAAQLLGVGQDVAVDAERRAVTDQRADEHRSARRPGIGSRLRTEPQLAQEIGHRRHVVGRRGDGEVDDALAGQTRDRGAADVLDDEVGSTLVDELGDGRRHLDGPRVPRLDRRMESGVGPDRRVHRASVDCDPMRQVIGRRVTEVDVG